MSIGPEEINWLAVVACGIGTFLVGGVWYTALFGKLWQRLSGYTHEQMETMKRLRPPPVFFGGMIVAYLVMALGMAALWGWCEIHNAFDGGFAGLFVGVAAAALGLTLQLASDKRLAAWIIDAVFILIVCSATGAVLGAWRP